MPDIPTTAINLQQQRYELRRKLIKTVREQSSFSAVYFVPLIFATIIATMGLLTNSAAVVIGAMLIAPLFWPIFGSSVGTITVQGGILSTSVRLLVVSIVIVLALSYGMASITPISEVSEQIQARINPTLLDLIVALASAIVGVVALYLPQFSGSVAGVAISISLLPPLCTAGIGIAFGSQAIFLGALLLFGANMSAIIFAGIITLYILHFRPVHGQEKARWFFGVVLATILMVVIAIPLSLFFFRALEQTQARQDIRETLLNQIGEIHPEATLDDLVIDFPQGFSEGVVEIKANVYLPEGVAITIDRKNQLTESVAEQAGTSIELQLNLLSTILLSREEDEEIRQLREQIREFIVLQLPRINSQLRVKTENIGVEIENNVLIEESEQAAVKVTMVLYQSNDVVMTFAEKVQLEQDVSQEIQRQTHIQVDLIPITSLQELDDQAQLKSLAENTLLQELAQITPSITLDQVEIISQQGALGRRFQINAYLRLPVDSTISYQDKLDLTETLQSALDSEDVNLELYLTRYQRVVPSIPGFDINREDLTQRF